MIYDPSVHTPGLHEVYKVEKALLVPSLLRRAVNGLDAEVRVIVPELPARISHGSLKCTEEFTYQLSV